MGKVTSIVKNKKTGNNLLKKFSSFQASTNQFRMSKMSDGNYGRDEIRQDA